MEKPSSLLTFIAKVKLYFPEIIVEQDVNGEYKFDIKMPANCKFTKVTEWGYVCFCNTNSSELKEIGVEIKAVTFSCEVEEEKLEETVSDLCKNINIWRVQLYQYSFLLGKPANGIIDDYWDKDDQATDFFVLALDDSFKVNIDRRIKLKATTRAITEFFTMNEIQEVLAKIDTRKTLSLEYQMFLNALFQRNKGNNRYAIMEATTAVELCVTNKIKEKCRELNIDGDGLCNVFYRSLGNRFDMLRYLGVELASENPAKEIVQPRNDLFHIRKLTPSDEICDEVIRIVRLYLKKYVPQMYE